MSSISSSDSHCIDIEGDNHPLAPKRTKITKKKLMSLLQSRDEEAFIEKYTKYQSTSCGSGDWSDVMIMLLVESIQSGMQNAFDIILGSRFNKQQFEGSQPIAVALQCGDHMALRKLFAHKWCEIANARELLTSAEFFATDDGVETMRVLLESERVHLADEYSERESPLHEAVKYRNWSAVALLLRHGACVGIVNGRGEHLVDRIPAWVLRQHFDSCVTTNGLSAADVSFEIRMNYDNFSFKPYFLERYGKCLNMKLCENSINAFVLRNQLAVVKTLANSPEHRQLLLHPLIASFMFVKWQMLSGVFYANLLCYTLFAVAIISFSLLKRCGDGGLTHWMGVLSWIGIGYVMVRELIQFLMTPLRYFRTPSNYLEMLMISLTVATLSLWHTPYDWHRYVDVLNILLVALELCVIMGSLPFLSMSQHMLMLREVTKNFLKSSALYSVLIVSFSVCFQILFGKTRSMSSGFHNFENPVAALGKTVVMLTGEFDASNFEFDNIYTYLIFLTFVVFLAIVLFNLLNGLAINDTQAIRAEAELHGSICRTKLLCRYEVFLTGHAKHLSLQRWLWLNGNMSHGLIAVRPNDGNRVFMPTRVGEMSNLCAVKTSFLALCCCRRIAAKFTRLDDVIVRAALKVLDQNDVASIEKRLHNIELRLNQIVENMGLAY